jgi:hypothetical protein
MLQAGEWHPDRNALFEFIGAKAKAFSEANEPVIPVDTNEKRKRKISGTSRIPVRSIVRAKTRKKRLVMASR